MSYRILSCRPDDELFLSAYQAIQPGAQASKAPEQDHLKECLVVLNEDAPLGRLALYRNPGIRHEGKPTAQLGQFECVDDAAAAKALLDAALDKARAMGAAFALGPMNGSTWNEYRFATATDGSPAFFTEHTHPAYYPALWQAAGFEAFQEYASNRAPIKVDPPESGFFARHGLTVRPIPAETFTRDLELLYPLCAEAFARNPLYTPITVDAFVARLIGLKPFLSTGLTRLVLDGGGEPAAFLLFLPDVLDPTGKTLVAKTAAKHPRCTIPGLATELYRTVMADAAAQGFEHVIHAFMHVDNRSLIGSRRLEGATFRQYSLFCKPC